MERDTAAHSLAMPAAPVIQKTSTPAFPQFYFEWHDGVRKVYVIEIPGEWRGGKFRPALGTAVANGTCIAEHCDTHGRFLGFVQTFLRGYRKGAADAKGESHGR